jgi:hypothetical protein
MKKLLLATLIGFAAWKAFNSSHSDELEDTSTHSSGMEVKESFASNTATPSFSCDGRVYCTDMTSRAEAEYFIRNCPGTKMDGDHDGIPCENDSRF